MYRCIRYLEHHFDSRKICKWDTQISWHILSCSCCWFFSFTSWYTQIARGSLFMFLASFQKVKILILDVLVPFFCIICILNFISMHDCFTWFSVVVCFHTFFKKYLNLNMVFFNSEIQIAYFYYLNLYHNLFN